MGKKVQKRGKCIFCGEGGLTKQHVLPNWLREYFPRTEKDTKTQNLLYYERVDNSLVATPKMRKTQGHLGTVRIRNVCETCNSGWMSRLENDTKPIVKELLSGHVVGMDRKKQELLCRWILLVNIMIEYTDVKTIAITESDRKTLMDGVIPEGWKIWIGYCKNKNWEFRYRHNAAKVMRKSDYKKGNDIPEKCNVQFTTIGIGRLYIHTIKSYSELLNPTIENYEDFGLMQICPYVKDIPVAIMPKSISDMDAEIIPDMIYGQVTKCEDINTVYIDASNLMR